MSTRCRSLTTKLHLRLRLKANVETMCHNPKVQIHGKDIKIFYQIIIKVGLVIL